MDDFIGFYDNYSGDAKYCRSASTHDKYYFTKTIIAFLCLEGSADFTIGFKEYHLSKNSFLAIGARVPFYYTKKDKDFKINIIAIDEEIFDNLAQGLVRIYFQRILHNSPLHRIPEDKVKMCNDIHAYLKSFTRSTDNFFKKQIVINYINILFFEACDILLHEPDEIKGRNLHQEEITSNFVKLLEKNILVSRKVEYFADKMNLTPKYLSTVIKLTTGRTASAWIDDYTMLEARHMLRTTDKTIQQISYELGFSSPSHFSKFFKDKKGITPKEARSRLEY